MLLNRLGFWKAFLNSFAVNGFGVVGRGEIPVSKLTCPPWCCALAGVAATKLQNKKFYPMVCSTAAKSSMKVIRSCASRTSLQYLCCFRLRQLLPDYVDTLEVLPLPPGLKQVLHNKLGWVLSMNYSTSKPSSSSSSGSDSDSSCGSDAEACQRKRCRRT